MKIVNILGCSQHFTSSKLQTLQCYVQSQYFIGSLQKENTNNLNNINWMLWTHYFTFKQLEKLWQEKGKNKSTYIHGANFIYITHSDFIETFENLKLLKLVWQQRSNVKVICTNSFERSYQCVHVHLKLEVDSTYWYISFYIEENIKILTRQTDGHHQQISLSCLGNQAKSKQTTMHTHIIKKIGK